MELHFNDTGYRKDFRASECVPSDWTPDAEDYIIEFIAYDCSSCQTERECDTYERGLDYECIVRVVHDPFFGDKAMDEIELARFAAAYASDAEEMLQRCADAIFDEGLA